MTDIKKEFSIDLLRALDIGVGGNLLSDEEYLKSIVKEDKNELKKAVNYLIKQGYKKCLSNSDT